MFVCNDWIRSDLPEVFPSVELLPGLPVPLILRYRLEVMTADLKGAATTSNVFVEMQGRSGKIGPVQLDSPTAFQKGKVRLHLDILKGGRILRTCPPAPHFPSCRRMCLRLREPTWAS